MGKEGTEPRAELRESLLPASDAQADTAPAGGYIACVDGRVSAAYCQMVRVLDTWGHRGVGPVTCIAVCECSIIICTWLNTALWDIRALVRRRRVLWLLDNSASLHALIKGPQAAFI